MDVFRFFRHPSEGHREDRPEKRRAQVRRAQQTYRLRKDQYTKSLENEVARLSSVETDLAHKIQSLRSTVRTLGNLLANSGIYVNLPASLAIEENESGPDAGLGGYYALGADRHASERLHRDVFAAPGAEAASAVGSPETAAPRGFKAPPVGDTPSSWPEILPSSCSTSWLDHPPTSPEGTVPMGSHRVPAYHTTPHGESARLGDLDPTTVGMEFVLALEAPCLGHIHGDPEKPHQPSGHALTVSSHLLFLSPDSHPSTRALHEACGKAPASILDRLLTLSTSLTLEDEITPVQAWNRIRCQPHIGQLGVDRLRSLTKTLGEAIKCHGFGAVLKKDAFEKLVRKALVKDGTMV